MERYKAYRIHRDICRWETPTGRLKVAFVTTYTTTMVRYGFGEKTGETEKGGLSQYENGHVEVSNQAFKWASEEFPSEPPAGAVGLALARLAGVDLADHADSQSVDIDYGALAERVEEIDGVGESTAEAVVSAVQTLLDGDTDA